VIHGAVADNDGSLVWWGRPGSKGHRGAVAGGGIEVVEVHNHGLDEQPRLFSLHFWAIDDAVVLAECYGWRWTPLTSNPPVELCQDSAATAENHPPC
jgi:hypothetical protein